MPTSCTGTRPDEHPGVEVGAGPGQPVGGEVGLLHDGQHRGDPVDEAGRQPPHEDAGRLRRPAQPGARQDVRWGAHREPDPGRTVVGEVGGDLHAGVAAADDQHVTPRVGASVAVVAGEHDLAGEAVEPGPVGRDGRVVVARGDDDVVGRGSCCRRRGARPSGRRLGAGGLGPVDALDPRPRDAARGGGARHTTRGSGPRRRGPPSDRSCAGSGSPGRPGPAARGVQVQPVVVPSPRAADLRCAVDDERVDTVRLQGRGDGETARSGSDDDHLDASHAANATHPGRIRGVIRVSAA